MLDSESVDGKRDRSRSNAATRCVQRSSSWAPRPERAEDTVHECADVGIEHVWMHRGPDPGSVSEAAADYGREHGIAVIDGGCPCVFGPTADPAHNAMRTVLTLTGDVPRKV